MKLIILLPLALSLMTAGCGNIISQNKNPSVCWADSCFQVELARNAEERAQGLMNRPRLDQDAGMLFIFPQKKFYSFWMKNTLIPLDIVWLDENKRVVDVSRQAQPCRQDPCPLITSRQPAQFVLEINAGLADKNGLKVGDLLSWSLN